jgi:hypothetical protein
MQKRKVVFFSPRNYQNNNLKSQEMESNPYASASAIPATMRYSDVQPQGIQGSSKIIAFTPMTANTYSNVNSSECIIPISDANGFLDAAQSYLTFDVYYDYANNYGANARAVVSHAAHFIRRLKVTAASSAKELESIDNYARLHSILHDNQVSSDYKTSFEGKLHGCNFQLGLDAGGAIGRVGPYKFSVPLMSFLGTASQKLIPLFLTGPLHLSLLFDGLAITAPANETRNWTIQNVRYHGHIVKPDDSSVIDRLKQMVAVKGLFLHFQSWKHYQDRYASSGTVAVSDAAKSCNGLMMGVFRESTAIATEDPMIRECKITSFSVRCGNTLFPSVPIGDDCVLQMEFNKLLGVYAALDHPGLPNDVRATKRAYGISMSGFGPKSGVLSGWNMSTSRGCEVTYTAGAPGNALAHNDFLSHFWLNYDIVAMITADGRLEVFGQ